MTACQVLLAMRAPSSPLWVVALAVVAVLQPAARAATVPNVISEQDLAGAGAEDAGPRQACQVPPEFWQLRAFNTYQRFSVSRPPMKVVCGKPMLASS